MKKTLLPILLLLASFLISIFMMQTKYGLLIVLAIMLIVMAYVFAYLLINRKKK